MMNEDGPQTALAARGHVSQGIPAAGQIGAMAAVAPTTTSLLEVFQKHNSMLNEYMMNMRDEMVRLTGTNAVTHREEGPPSQQPKEVPMAGFVGDFGNELARYQDLLMNIEQLRTQLSQL